MANAKTTTTTTSDSLRERATVKQKQLKYLCAIIEVKWTKDNNNNKLTIRKYWKHKFWVRIRIQILRRIRQKNCFGCRRQN